MQHQNFMPCEVESDTNHDKQEQNNTIRDWLNSEGDLDDFIFFQESYRYSTR